jgi:hypothetical protein
MPSWRVEGHVYLPVHQSCNVTGPAVIIAYNKPRVLSSAPFLIQHSTASRSVTYTGSSRLTLCRFNRILMTNALGLTRFIHDGGTF